MQNRISATIVADSICPRGNRITTYELVFPRIVLAEFNTHRALSRNSASSRAIPSHRMIELVQNEPFIPMRWMKKHKGMQGNTFFENETCKDAWLEVDRCFGYSQFEEKSAVEHLIEQWLIARDNAVQQAETFRELGVSKQIINRLLEPFMYHRVLVTGTEWQNFFALRANDQAEIHIQDLAFKMLSAYNSSTPKLLQPGEWHMPYGDQISDEDLKPFLFQNHETESERTEVRLKIATARAARLSYQTLGENPKIDFGTDINVHNGLLESGHWSPFEHCAQVMDEKQMLKLDEPGDPLYPDGWCGNFRGFIQYRKMFSHENRTDSRVLTAK